MDPQMVNSKPLTNKKIVITRARNQAEELAALIEMYGGKTVLFPVIKFIPPDDDTQYIEAFNKLEEIDWLIFTSVNGVESFFAKIAEYKIDINRLIKAKIVAVGSKTKQILQDIGLKVDLVPEEFKAEGLYSAIENYLFPGQKVLLPKANIARKFLPEKLKEKGLAVYEIDTYKTVADAENKEEIIMLLKQKKIDYITFTSSSTVINFIEAMKNEDISKLLQGIKLASIGPVTTKTGNELELKIDITAKDYTIEGLIDAIIEDTRK